MKPAVAREAPPGELLDRVQALARGFAGAAAAGARAPLPAGGPWPFEELLLADYPGLGPACCGLLGSRIDAAVELLERYRADRALLGQALFQGRDPGPILGLKTGLSDPHGGGRSVARLTFAGGLAVYHHPKDLGLFGAFTGLLAWINARGNPWPLRLTRMVERPGYGWMEEVPWAPCADAEAVGRFYHRAGQLLCLVYALNGSDIHRENLIACGDQPVLIDLETLVQPELDPAHFPPLLDPSVALVRRRYFADSVLRTAMLPFWRFTPEGVAYDSSGLGDSGRGESRLPTWGWEPLNTDGMRRVRRTVPRPPAPSAVCLGRQPVLAQDHLSELSAGFAWMHRFLQAQRAALLAPEGPLAALKGRAGRFLMRDTELYAHLLDELATPQAFQEVPGTGPCLRGLARVFASGEAHPLWPIYQGECRALLRRDVPRFTQVTDALTLGGAGLEPVPGAFASTGVEALEQRLGTLDPADLERQLAILRGSFILEAAPPLGALAAQGAPWRQRPAPAPEVGWEPALAVAQGLRVSALSAGPGSVTWLGIRHHPRSGHGHLEPLTLRLYDGQAGVALFLAALEFATAGAGFRDLALAALRPLQARLGAGNLDRLGSELGLGGAMGCGSLVYALTRCAGWLDLPEGLAAAARVAALLTPDRIREDRVLDVLGGSAGACLGLLTLHGSLPEDRWLAAAVACGDHLLASRLQGPGDSRAWSTAGTGALNGGFAHGAAGIGYALLRLFAATGETRFREGAQAAQAFERALFDPQTGRWADQWDPQRGLLPEGGFSWCHGAPGIGLAAVGGLGILDQPEGRRDVEAAVDAILKGGLRPRAGLCCGTFGLVETLVTAGLRLGRPDWRAEGLRLAAAALAASPGPAFGLGEFHLPGLFQGGAGCGYQALRLAQGDRLPSVLLWE